MRKYYIADNVKKQRLPKVFNKLDNAIKYCKKLNKQYPGRYQCGDWVDHKEVGVDFPNEYIWQKD